MKTESGVRDRKGREGGRETERGLRAREKDRKRFERE